MTVNLNDNVWVRLTESGRAVLRTHDERLREVYPAWRGRLVAVDDEAAQNDGWSKWQLWSLMQDFGPAIHLGCTPPFETTIRLTAPDSVSVVDAKHSDGTRRSAAPK